MPHRYWFCEDNILLEGTDVLIKDLCVCACVSLCVCQGQSRLLQEQHHCLLNFRRTAVSYHFHLTAGHLLVLGRVSFLTELSYLSGLGRAGCGLWAIVVYRIKE